MWLSLAPCTVIQYLGPIGLSAAISSTVHCYTIFRPIGHSVATGIYFLLYFSGFFYECADAWAVFPLGVWVNE